MSEAERQGRMKRLAGVAFSAALAIVFGLVFYTANTPLGPCISSDNAMYLTMGTALAQGYAPYTEIFDHKGPLLFILQALPQALSGGYSTLAVFIQQALFRFAGLRVIEAIARRMGVRCGALAQLAYLALIASLVSGGNLTEEYANLFTLAGLYVVLRVFDGEERSPGALMPPAVLLGALAMLCLLTRANNALPLCGAALGLSLWLLASRRLAQLGACALGFLAGALLTALPVAFWLASRGALSASIYGAFIHNMMYAETEGLSRVSMLLHSGYGRFAMLMAALTCAGALAMLLRTRRLSAPMALVFAAAAGGAAAFISHKYYNHYLILGAPAAAVGVCALLASVQDVKRAGLRRALLCAVLAVSCLWLGEKGRIANADRLAEIAESGTLAQDARALYAQVPEAERDSFMAYRVEPKWYVYAEALPCMRFYFLQEILAQADPAVMDEIVETFESDPPCWLVIFYNREFGPPYDGRIAAIFEQDYEFVDARGQYQLLRRKEGA